MFAKDPFKFEAQLNPNYIPTMLNNCTYIYFYFILKFFSGDLADRLPSREPSTQSPGLSDISVGNRGGLSDIFVIVIFVY